MSDEILDYKTVLENPAAYVTNDKPEQVETEPETVTEAEVKEEITEEPSEESILAESEEVAEVEAEAPKKKSDRSAEKRIAKLIKEREQLKGQLQQVSQQTVSKTQTSPVTQVATNDPDAPNPALYDDELDYKLDVRDYQRNKAKREQEALSKIQDAYTKYPDLQELVEEDAVKTNPTMLQCIKESELTGDLFYHLMAHPEIGNRIAALGPIATAKEIGKIEALLIEREKAKAAPVVKKVAALPAPIKPVKTSSSSQPVKQTKYTQY